MLYCNSAAEQMFGYAKDELVGKPAFTLLPRAYPAQAFGIPEGIPDRYEFHLSADGEIWTLAVQGEFTDLKSDPGMRLIPLPKPMTGRFIRFVAKHVVDDIDCVIVATRGKAA